MKKVLFIVAFAVLFTFVNLTAYAQSPTQKRLAVDEPIPKKVSQKKSTADEIEIMHQIYLRQPAKSLNKISYEDGRPLEGELTHDGMRVYIKNYDEKGRVAVQVTRKGEQKPYDFITSKCAIDPVPPL